MKKGWICFEGCWRSTCKEKRLAYTVLLCTMAIPFLFLPFSLSWTPLFLFLFSSSQNLLPFSSSSFLLETPLYLSFFLFLFSGRICSSLTIFSCSLVPSLRPAFLTTRSGDEQPRRLWWPFAGTISPVSCTMCLLTCLTWWHNTVHWHCWGEV